MDGNRKEQKQKINEGNNLTSILDTQLNLKEII